MADEMAEGNVPELLPRPPLVPRRKDASFVFAVRRTDSRAPAKAITLSGPVIKIGRLSSCHLNLADPSVSRMHAVIEVSDGDVAIIDLGSAHGTRVNNKLVTKATIEPGDTLGFGVVEVEFNVAEQDTVGPDTRLCPQCRKPMARAMLNKLRVEHCALHGVWFDPGELQLALHRFTD